ncbi:type I-E CRISPR-associated protein Cse2/CasB [Streptomyces sp. M19]
MGPNGAWPRGVPDGPPGEDLAALRAGLGKPAGTVPQLWPYYTVPTDGVRTDALEAEHGALSLYGLHQQGSAPHAQARGRLRQGAVGAAPEGPLQ